jgi:predicted DNA-binding protein
MSIPDSGTGRSGVKTLAIRLEPDLHAQLSLIAQLRGSTITDEIRTAVEAHIEHAKTAPELAAQADTVLADIERDAAARRDAIASMFGSATSTASAGSGRGRKTSRGEADTSDS